MLLELTRPYPDFLNKTVIGTKRARKVTLMIKVLTIYWSVFKFVSNRFLILLLEAIYVTKKNE